MKDFDEERQKRTESDRGFKIGGEHFVAKASVRPEVLVAFEAITPEMSPSAVIAIVDDTIKAMIEPNEDAFARYDALRLREDDALSLDDLQNVGLWLVEAETGRPTEQPGGSSAGPGSIGTTSTGTSFSPDSPEVQED